MIVHFAIIGNDGMEAKWFAIDFDTVGGFDFDPPAMVES
jgi:hypothetical protein